ncbi:G5 domain-containing protein [Microbacterium sp. VKM Ac-2923]|uniref:G5 domain-containing protein n=1 Tax=Microbacterium sp. VKM Ac-2923 TaxID=2929476 RepID=UPI001FB214B6|nr:G5 domain-containing protein [Microbacterium sp. VKM Ac-2923]MCJ1707903.1 G5 domain-containing protein [Microbacterium sp. VKM Ac-2923]
MTNDRSSARLRSHRPGRPVLGLTAAVATLLLAAGCSSPASSADAAATGDARRIAASSPSASPTPVVVVSEQTVTSALRFERTTVDDAALPSGQSLVSTAGVDGEKVSIFRVTTIDGVESERVLVSESVGRAPVSEVTARGTYVAPPPPAPVEAASSGDGCDPNYADACVPIDSDVDCAGGKGNGPSYFDGVARVVGSDIYKLDGDGDGLACNGSR